MTKLFISYRRDDSAGHAGRLSTGSSSTSAKTRCSWTWTAGEKALARVPLSGTGTQAQAGVTLGKPISLPAAGSATH